MVAAKNISLAALLWVGLASKGLAMGIDEATNDLVMVERTVTAPKPAAGKMSIQVVRDEAPELDVRTPPKQSGGQGKKQAGPRRPGEGGAGRPDRVGPIRVPNKPTGAGKKHGHGTRDIDDELFERDFEEILEVRTPPRMPGQGGAGRPDRVGPIRSSNKPTGAGRRGHGTRDIEEELLEVRTPPRMPGQGGAGRPDRVGPVRSSNKPTGAGRRGHGTRDIDEELFEREFDEELDERDFDDELFERDFDDELFERDFDDELFERDFDDELFERDFEEMLEVRTPPRMPGQGGAGRPDRVGPVRSSNKPTGAGRRGHGTRSLDTRLNRAVPLHMAPGGPASGIYSGRRHKGTRDIFERTPPRMPGQGGAGRPDRVGPVRSSNKPTGAGRRGHGTRSLDTRLNRAVPLHLAPGGPASGIYSGRRHKGTRDIFERTPPRMPGQGGAGRPDRVGPVRSSNKPTGAGHRGHRIRDVEEEWF